METTGNADDLARLYSRFGQSIRENDAAAVRQLYRELRVAGRPLQEILDEASANATTAGNLEEILLGDHEGINPQPIVTPKLLQSAPTAAGIAHVNPKSRPGAADVEEVSSTDAAPIGTVRRISQLASQSRLIWLSSGMANSAIGFFVFLSLMSGLHFDWAQPLRATVPRATTADSRNSNAAKAGFSITRTMEPTTASVNWFDEHSPPDAVASLTALTSQPEPRQTRAEETASTQLEPKTDAQLGGQDGPRSASTSGVPLSNAQRLELLNRGDALFAVGDITAARQFYQRVAEAGYGEAAVRLGESYDPAFLHQARLPGARSDVTAAKLWYHRAVELGAQEAEILLKAMQTD